MQNTTQPEVCSFCGTTDDGRSGYAGGFGVLMCSECVDHFHTQMARSEPDAAATPSGGRRRVIARYDPADMTDEQVLEMLPRIAGAAQLVNRFLAEWVQQIRERRLSWTAIGTAMGVSRQAAWERFTRVLGTEHQPSSRS